MTSITVANTDVARVCPAIVGDRGGNRRGAHGGPGPASGQAASGQAALGQTDSGQNVAAVGGWRAAHGGGFTLIELLIVLAVIAILTTIAIASYDYAVIKANRSAAAGCLLQEAQRMEQFYTTSLTYLNVRLPNVAPLSACVQDVQVTDATYNFSAVVVPATNSFTLTATPKGRQLRDTFCVKLNINQIGFKSVSGPPTPSWPVDRCF